MKQIITLFFVACAISFSNAQALLEIYKTDVAPTVDGVIDENDPWGEDWVKMEQAKENNSTDAMSAYFQLLHDYSNLYVVIKVEDDSPNTDAVAFPKPFKRDNCEVFFSMGGAEERENAEFESGDWQVRCQRGSADDTFINGAGNIAALLAEDSGFEFAVLDGGAEYVQEFIFPLAVLAEESIFDGENFRFEIQAADNTGADRTQQQFWNNNTDEQWHNTNTFAAVHLNEEYVPVVAVKEVNASLMSAYISNNMLQVNNANGAVVVFDVTGKLIVNAEIKGNGSIDMSKFNSGLYVVKSGDYSVKIIK